MATITTTISPIPDAGHRGIDARTEFVNKQEAFQDALTDVFVSQINSFGIEVNQAQVRINQSELNTLGYRDTTKTYRDETLTNKNLTLQYKTSTELAYSNTVTLLGTLVIPTEATYNKDYIDDIKRRDFLNFKIGA